MAPTRLLGRLSNDVDGEVPDFLIPDAKNPQFVLEVHRTEAWNHFQMKTLRSVTAVAEAKASLERTW
jgi:hypothetical protein